VFDATNKNSSIDLSKTGGNGSRNSATPAISSKHTAMNSDVLAKMSNQAAMASKQQNSYNQCGVFHNQNSETGSKDRQ